MRKTNDTEGKAVGIHYLLLARCLSPAYHAAHKEWGELTNQGYIERQAVFCPHYVRLHGQLGNDWGIITDPMSIRFGLLTFEHDWCGHRIDHNDTEDTRP